MALVRSLSQAELGKQGLGYSLGLRVVKSSLCPQGSFSWVPAVAFFPEFHVKVARQTDRQTEATPQVTTNFIASVLGS